MNSHAASRVPAKESAKAGARPVAEGRNGVSATPPSYGIAFLDEALPGVASARHMRTHELQSNPVVQERLGGPSVAKRRESAPPSETRTGLPEDIKSGVESLSGLSMDNVTVHYNSSHPARINALAYTQGTDIHVAPGQERHLPHEAWHVVQQAQGRVKPTMQMKDGVPLNDDKVLEHEADVMGTKGAVLGHLAPPSWFSQDRGGLDQARPQRQPISGLRVKGPLNFLSSRAPAALHDRAEAVTQRDLAEFVEESPEIAMQRGRLDGKFGELAQPKAEASSQPAVVQRNVERFESTTEKLVPPGQDLITELEGSDDIDEQMMARLPMP